MCTYTEIQTVEYLLSHKNNEICHVQQHQRMDLEVIIVSEVSQTKKDKLLHDIIYPMETKKTKRYK